MRKTTICMITAISLASFTGVSGKNNEDGKSKFSYSVEKFADAEILRYTVPEFEELPLEQKQLLFHLSEAALMGRDIMYDQNCAYNIPIRRTFEAIYKNYKGDKKSDDFKNFEVYLKRVWLSNGIHHHYGVEKFIPEFSKEFFLAEVENVKEMLPVRKGQSVEEFVSEITPVIFDNSILTKRTVQSGDGDWILESANNYYGGGITKAEVEQYNAKHVDLKDNTPISFGLNSRLVKEADGTIKEYVWKVGGTYSKAIERIVDELEKAKAFAENDDQRTVIERLCDFYRTGDLKTFDEYSISWVKDTASRVDFVNGFIESYGDPIGMKASWESITNFKNLKASGRTTLISDSAQWFEDNSPVDSRFKKEKVKGITAKVITVAMLGGDCYPTTPIGINLPNADWIRRDFGSKSVTIENITEAYDKASEGNGFAEEFVWSEAERVLMKDYGFLTDNLHTDLHECLGHASGKQLPGVSSDLLQAYGSTLEEARADLFALYYLPDAKLLSMGLLPNADAYKAEYYKYMMNGLMTQLVRIEVGKSIEEAHMRNRALIARWVLEKGADDKVVEIVKRDGKSYVVVNNYERMRELFGELLAEVQRIKSEGDFEAGKLLVENYGVSVDPELHAEILIRSEKLNIAPYRGFVNPVMKLVKDNDGKVIDVTLDYTEGYAEQMLRYSKDYSFLPSYN